MIPRIKGKYPPRREEKNEESDEQRETSSSVDEPKSSLNPSFRRDKKPQRQCNIKRFCALKDTLWRRFPFKRRRFVDQPMGRSRHERTRAAPVDFLVISAIWSVRAPKKVLDALKDAVFAGKVLNVQPFALSVAHSAIFSILICLSTVFVSYYFAHSYRKFWIVIVSLYIYSLCSIFGLLFVQFQNTLFAFIVEWVQMGWWIAVPLRFFLIFHQRLPIRVEHSRALTTYNEIFIGMTSYFSTLFIVQSNGFSERFYLVAWTTSFCLILLWLAVFHFFKGLLLETPVQTSEIGELYQETGFYDSFIHRHETNRVRIFCALLFPGCMFRLLFFSLTLAITPYKYTFFFFYRLDLIITIIILLGIQYLLGFISTTQEEFKDLYVIGIGHIVNVLALVLFLTISPKSSESKVMVESRMAIEKVVSVILLHPDDWEGRFSVLMNGYEPNTTTHTGVYLARMLTQEDVIDLVGYSTDNHKVCMFTHTFNITVESTHVFVVRSKGEPLMEVSCEIPQLALKTVKIVVVNLEPTCRTDVNSVGLFFKGHCVRVSLIIDEYHPPDIYVKRRHKTTLPEMYSGMKPLILKTNGSNETRYLYFLLSPGSFITPPASSSARPPDILMLFIFKKNDLFNFNLLSLRDMPSASHLPSQSPGRDENPLSVLTMSSLSTMFSVTIGAAQISYLHFAWISCPFENRTLILAAFFGFDYLFTRLFSIAVFDVTAPVVAVLLGMQVSTTVWHTLWTWRLTKFLSPLKEYDVTKGRQF